MIHPARVVFTEDLGLDPDEDLGRAMPLDDHVPRPRLNSTMAITVNAPPEHIWPWLAQIGEAPRAGYYS